ncbi:PWWP domain-containing protein 2 [Podospora aff. communis PSN243]|uniref:PWWP domain-containing protein 2 n=1 Tax=Podospora aff. communis PSN243 TaxID=3040156 RepID=A0AAV9GS63_9PEZI|nr:PWWP domain-containing protein 2 [Podospora aff. communis PSN243]
MTDSAPPAEAPAADAEESAAPAAATPGKAKTPAKRKSVGAADAKGKKLNKKASKARILHLDAQPGDHYFVKLKGFPQWPVIICDEDMLPHSLLRSRPVTAKRADGTYRDDYADGAKKAGDRTFPVMYLHTNEFGWVPNSDLIDLDPATVMDVKMDKMRKDLQVAYELASHNHPLSHYKELLQQYQEDLMEQEKAKEAKAAAKATPKGKKAKATVDEDGDVDMDDAADEDDAAPKEKKSAKKRKAEDTAETPARSDSVKKPKIKLTTSLTPKTNGAAAPAAKPAKTAEPKAAKPKAKKAKESEEKKAEKEPTTPKEPALSAEEKHQRKEVSALKEQTSEATLTIFQKEVLFLRHKLQKGLLTRDQEPKEEEMKAMSDYIGTLEGYPDLEVSIIRVTKINKVLKAILKLDNIPKEAEFQLKPRSQALLDKWNKLLASDSAPAAAATEPANGVNGSKEAKTNGVKEKSEGAEEKAKEEPKGAKEEPKEPKEVAKTGEASASTETASGAATIPATE